MARPFELYEPLERAWSNKDGWTRKGVLAVEVLDAVTLQRISSGITVTAKGLRSAAIVNHGGLFTWRGTDLAGFAGVVVDPGLRPFTGVDLAAADVVLPLHTVALQPRANYAFAPGTTAIRGTLLETVPPQGVAPTPIINASIRLEWLDDGGTTWHAPPQRFITDADGEFVAFIPFVSVDQPQLAADGTLQLRLFAQRMGVLSLPVERSIAFAHPQGRTVDAIYAWDQMQ
jgi:hypothetical protein